MRQAEAGTAVGDVCRQLGISETTFYAWKKKYAHLASMKQPLALPGWKSFHRYRLQRRGNRKVPGGQFFFAHSIAVDSRRTSVS